MYLFPTPYEYLKTRIYTDNGSEILFLIYVSGNTILYLCGGDGFLFALARAEDCIYACMQIHLAAAMHFSVCLSICLSVTARLSKAICLITVSACVAVYVRLNAVQSKCQQNLSREMRGRHFKCMKLHNLFVLNSLDFFLLVLYDR